MYIRECILGSVFECILGNTWPVLQVPNSEGAAQKKHFK